MLRHWFIILRKAKMRIYRNSLSSNHCMASIKSLSNSRTMLCINGTINSILQSLVNIIRLKLFVHLNIYLQWGDTLNMHLILLLYQESVLQLHESKDDVIIAVATSVHFINSSISRNFYREKFGKFSWQYFCAKRFCDFVAICYRINTTWCPSMI